MKKPKGTSVRVMETAMRKGADSAQAREIVSETDEVNFENNRLKSAESSERTRIVVKAVKDEKLGTSFTTDPCDIDGVVDRALEAADFGSPARFKMPGPQTLHDVKTRDPTLLPLTKAEMIGLARGMVDRIVSYNPEIMAWAWANKTVTKEEIANSSGASYQAEHTDFSIGAGGQLVRGTDILTAFHNYSRKKLTTDTEAIAERAIEYFRMADRIASVHTGDMPVIFTPMGLYVLLLTLTMGLDGKNVFLGDSPLRDKLGHAIADPRFTLVDDPLLDYGPRTGAFDDEGVPHGRLPLIENGVLRSFVYDQETAHAAGVKPTGHGSERQLTNLIIDPGDVSCTGMLRGVKRGLLAHGFLGAGQGNTINGEFSLNVWLGYEIENGEIAGRVKDVMLAGNAYDALKDITAISREREWIGGPLDSLSGLFPYVSVGALSVVAK